MSSNEVLINIRLAEKKDADEIARVHCNTWQVTYKGIVPDSYLEEVRSFYCSGESRQFIEESIEHFDKSVWVAEFDDQIAGFIEAGPNRFSELPYDAEIYAIYVDPLFQGRGLGRLLFDAFRFHFLPKYNFKSFGVRVLSENRSVEFYKKQGGKVLSTSIEEIGGKDLEVFSFCWD